MDDLVQRDGLWYEKFNDIPFSGKIDEGRTRTTFEDGKREGSWQGYYKNGQLHGKGEYVDGKKSGFWVFYHDNGHKSLEGKYINGKKEGVWVSYHKNLDGSKGTKYESLWSGTFKNGVKVSD